MTILSLGVVVLILAATGIVEVVEGLEGLELFGSSSGPHLLHILDITCMALLIDGAGRIYFGIRNKTTNRWSGILSIISGIIEIIIGIYLQMPLSLTDVTFEILVALCVVTVGVRDDGSGYIWSATYNNNNISISAFKKG